MEHESYLKLAVQEAYSGIRNGEGGPFGAVIVRDGTVIGKGHNSVLVSADPTAHAEVNAIRDACRKQQTHHLTGSVIYTNFEPCPMCLSAIYWADIRMLYFASGMEDAARIGFMDNHLYKEISLTPERREIRTTQITLKEMGPLLEEFNGMDGKILY